MDGRSIPGFYYDKEKRKYFQILPSHHGSRPESKYTKDNIEIRSKQTKKRKRDAELQQKLAKERVQRSRLHSSLGGICLNRELDHHESIFKNNHARARTSVRGMGATIHNLPSDNSSRIVFFDVDPVTKALYAAKANNTIEFFHLKPDSEQSRTPAERRHAPGLPPGTDLGTWPLADFERLFHRTQVQPAQIRPPTTNRYRSGKLLQCLTSEASSLNICHGAQTLVTTSLGSDRTAEIHLSSLNDSVGIYETYRPRESRTIWTAAPSPSSDNHPPTIAVACSNGAKILTLSPAGWNSSEGFQAGPDIRALTWLSPNQLAIGLRDGSILLSDPRDSDTGRQCLRHHYTISNMCLADDPTRLLVSGGTGSLMLFDLRMLQPKGKKKRKSTYKAPVSAPLLTYDHSFPATDRHALDVHGELGLIAAGRDDSAICLYSLQTGDLLKSFLPPREDNHPDSFLRFVDDERGVPKIMTTRGKHIVELAW